MYAVAYLIIRDCMCGALSLAEVLLWVVAPDENLPGAIVHHKACIRLDPYNNIHINT